MRDLDLAYGFDGAASGRTDAAFPYPSEELLGAVIVPPPPLLPDPSTDDVRYLSRLYTGWSSARFGGAGSPFARRGDGLLLAAEVMRARGIRPALWLATTERAWRATLVGSPSEGRKVRHPAIGWVYSRSRLDGYTPSEAVVVPTRAPSPALGELLGWRARALLAVAGGADAGPLLAEYDRRIAAAREATAWLSAENARLVDTGAWLWG